VNQNQVGKSGLFVSEVTLGTMLFGENSNRSTPEEEAHQIIDHFISMGGTHIDTANAYADGESEAIIGRSLQLLGRHRVTLASKARFASSIDADFAGGLSRKVIKTQVEKSLRRLKTDYLDLYYMHGWDPNTPIEESLRAYEELIREGKILYMGVSNFRAWQVMKALSISDSRMADRFICGQYQYSLVNRDIDNEYFSLFESEGLGCMAWGPLGGGFLTGKYQQDVTPNDGRISQSDNTVEEAWWRRNTDRNWRIVAKMKEIADAHQSSVSQIAIAWLLKNKRITTAIIGPRTLAQCQDNMLATNIRLSNEEFDALDALSAPLQSYPYSMIKAYGME
jgi:aryl-alcohol dehydrogenase-like predicted oxidoreductase